MAYVVDRILGEVDIETDVNALIATSGRTPSPTAPALSTRC